LSTTHQSAFKGSERFPISELARIINQVVLRLGVKKRGRFDKKKKKGKGEKRKKGRKEEEKDERKEKKRKKEGKKREEKREEERKKERGTQKEEYIERRGQ